MLVKMDGKLDLQRVNLDSVDSRNAENRKQCLKDLVDIEKKMQN